MQTLVEPSRELLEECKSGNQRAFKEIFYNYRSYAYNMVYKITGPYGDHADLLQDLFFQVYLSLKTFRGDSSFKTWFHRIIIHVCTRRWRYQKAEKRISAKDIVDLDTAENEVRSHRPNHGEQFELKDMVYKALGALEDKLRVPLILNVYSDMDLSEIADVMEIPEGTVKSRLFTARKKMKEFIDGLNNEI